MTLRRFEMYSVNPGAPKADAEAMAHVMLEGARYIPELLHSAIGRARSATALNFVWEHAYGSPAAYRRYMAHPYHASLLDRFLMPDSPQQVIDFEGSGMGLIGYRCEPGEYYIPAGARRVLGLKLAAGAESAFADITAAELGRGGMILSLFKDNFFGPRWLDGETLITPEPELGFIWEQGFSSLDAALAYDWSERVADLVEKSVEVVYAIEPGYGYSD